MFGSSKHGWMNHDFNEPTDNLWPLMDAIVDVIPEAPYREGTSTDADYVSRLFLRLKVVLAIGRVFRGDLHVGKDYMLCKRDGVQKKVRIKELDVFVGLGKMPVETVRSGDICAIVGLEDFEIGDTLADLENPEALTRIKVDEPTMSMLFTINNSPFFGKEGKFVTSRHLRDRLMKETEKNLALRVQLTDTEDKFVVHGRGILHLSVLIETMRREGYELQVGKPQVILKEG